jgi:mannose-6-phosphate isomerase class I
MPKPQLVVTRGEFSALEGFLAAYLHEDYAEEHATPADALEEFLEDATPDDIERLNQDWQAFRARVAPLPDRVRCRLLVDALGSAWAPDTFDDVDALFAKLTH